MKSRSKVENEGFWKEHSERWKTSGMSQKAYCEDKGITYRSFVYQHNRLLRQIEKSSLKFIETKPEPMIIRSQSVMLPNGIRIGIDGEVNSALLQTVLIAAGAISC